ncbi:MAG: hypothetical protein ACE5GS_10140 [Kiloniellaceae bacterium]
MARTPLVFLVALIFWAVYFYLLDRSIMDVQGLPVGWDLMPVS